MTDPFFFTRAKSLTIGEIVELTGADPISGSVSDRRITGVAALDRAAPSDLAFLESAKYLDQLTRTRAGACLLAERFAQRAPAGLIVLRTREPYRAFVQVARTLFPDSLRPSSLFYAAGVSSSAFVHPSARLEPGVSIDPAAVIGPGAEIGAGTLIGAAAVIGPSVRIGRDCAVGPGATIVHALLGDRVIIHAGCRIGQDGFGYVMGPGGHLKVPQLRRVIIQDNVEIGANTTIDRGGLSDTVIGEGTKIDNLVQIGHNVRIGRHCIIVAQTGISGSAVLEDYAVLGGQVGLADHVTIGTGAMIAAQSGVIGDVPAGARWGGYPAGPAREWLRATALLRRMLKDRSIAGNPAVDDDHEETE
jgi:UDP-3-O-[3-hydroxymyristoyl] glucosamine N-acyltransferase